ncbi:hypothetical protein [Sulfurovum sp. TSL1]|uniref:hypothetical protein n=1 Tax=Sulfurovum sp. TSL1 TaxID=2826994 RepID=UPI001CC587CC|nr:hypothetical protein [Sulfurovum sp. TSL1]GIT98801.1 hypothetical protein TSL1_16220 [Sulfurovum sp. TSL1]
MLVQEYNNIHNNVTWYGFSVQDNQNYQTFMENNVRSHLNDEEARETVENHLRLLVADGFQVAALDELLNAEHQEERDWAVGESFAEAVLEDEYNVEFPWNQARDLRNENASLPGADIVGLINDNGQQKLLFGEVKTSVEERCPPNVLYGRGGMISQLETIGTNLTRLLTLVKWLFHRCKDTIYETSFNEAMQNLFNHDNQGMFLVGILIRPNLQANQDDLENRGVALGDTFVNTETHALLLAYYLPHTAEEFVSRAVGGNQ